VNFQEGCEEDSSLSQLDTSNTVSDNTVSDTKPYDKKCGKPGKMKRKSLSPIGMTEVLSGAAESIDKLVSAVTSRKTTEGTNTGHFMEPNNDDWLFCKRLYNKLINVQDGPQKEYFKLNVDTEVLKMTFGCSLSKQPFPAFSNVYSTGGYSPVQGTSNPVQNWGAYAQPRSCVNSESSFNSSTDVSQSSYAIINDQASSKSSAVSAVHHPPTTSEIGAEPLNYNCTETEESGSYWSL
jgi:hypothetical protein